MQQNDRYNLVPRNSQSLVLLFPYCWMRCRDGSAALLNRQYQPILRMDSDGKASLLPVNKVARPRPDNALWIHGVIDQGWYYGGEETHLEFVMDDPDLLIEVAAEALDGRLVTDADICEVDSNDVSETSIQKVIDWQVRQMMPIELTGHRPRTGFTLKNYASWATESGLAVIPVREDGSKAPDVRWKPYQERLPTEQEIEDWFDPDNDRSGFGIVCGAVSGNLECLDFDNHETFIKFQHRAEIQGLEDLFYRIYNGYSEVTPNGVHLIYRCPQISGSEVQARQKDGKPTIETRGEGGYFIAAPSSGTIHPSGKPYNLLEGSFDDIAEITPDERRQLFDLARSFDESGGGGNNGNNDREAKLKRVLDPGKPGDDFITQSTWSEVLEPHGWKEQSTTPEGVTHWTRPGKNQGTSATTNVYDSDLLHVFSSNAGPFEAGGNYNRFAAYAYLNHDGDFKEAASDLRACGYGQPGAAVDLDKVLGQCIDQGSYSRENRPQSDIGNSERFLDLTRGRVRYVGELGVWLIWSGDRWEKTAYEFEIAKAVIRSIGLESASKNNDDRRGALIKWAIRSESCSHVTAILKLARQSAGIQLSASELDRYPALVGCANGVLDLQTGSLIKPDMNQFITKSLGASFSSDAQCPRWEQFIDEITGGDQKLAAYLQRLAGYALHGGNPEQIVAILHGTGSNGKSVFICVLQTLFNDYSRKIEPQSLMAQKGGNGGGPREDLVRLYRARLAVSLESSDGDRLDESLIKTLSGGDPLYARGLYDKHGIEFVPEFLLLLGTNHKPTIRGTDHAIWRRLTLIPFEKTFEGDNKDKHLLSKLLAERDGILTWLVEGYGNWVKHGLQPPSGVHEATAEYKRDSDILQDWTEDCCETGPRYQCLSSDLYDSYARWCKETGHRPMSSTRFGRSLGEKGFKKGRSSNRKRSRTRIGIDLFPGERESLKYSRSL